MYDDEFELTFDMAEDNAETVKLPGKPLQPAPEAPEAPEPAGKAKEPEVPDFPDDEPTIVIPARKPREMPKQEREPVRTEPVPELAPAEVKAPEEPAAAPEAPVPAIRTNGRTVLILRRISPPTLPSARRMMMSGLTPMPCSSLTECWAGLDLYSSEPEI